MVLDLQSRVAMIAEKCDLEVLDEMKVLLEATAAEVQEHPTHLQHFSAHLPGVYTATCVHNIFFAHM